MNRYLIAFIVFDTVVTTCVLWFVLSRRRASGIPGVPGVVSLENLKALGEFAKERHERIGEFMRANWSGIPDQLPGVLASLLDELERDARSRNLPADRETLKVLLATSLNTHRIGNGREVRDALARVAWRVA